MVLSFVSRKQTAAQGFLRPMLCPSRKGSKLNARLCGQVMTCPDCEGVGERSTPCNTCGGDGRVRKSKRIALRVPPGARHQRSSSPG